MKIKAAFTHAPIMIPGPKLSAIHTEKTLTQAKIPGIEMEYEPLKSPNVLKLKIGTTRALIPLDNIQVMLLDESKGE